MPEILVEFDTVITARDGTKSVPRAWGGIADDGLWEGWIEFLPIEESGAAIRTGRETKQPNRTDLIYWAEGLTQVYLEGALDRAERHEIGRERFARPVKTRKRQDGPTHPPVAGSRPVIPRTVLNPFEVYQQGQAILVQELAALNEGQLRDIAVAYGFADPESLHGATRARLTVLIAAGVRKPLTERRPREPRTESR